MAKTARCFCPAICSKLLFEEKSPHSQYGKKPRTYRKRARKDYLKYTRCRKHTAKMTRKAIVRGKAGKPVEFGAKLDISVVDGWMRPECCSFDAYNEAGNLREICRKWQSGSERERGITPAGSWRTKSTETGKISAIARRMGSVFPAQLWGGLRRVKPETGLRTIGMSASA